MRDDSASSAAVADRYFDVVSRVHLRVRRLFQTPNKPRQAFREASKINSRGIATLSLDLKR